MPEESKPFDPGQAANPAAHAYAEHMQKQGAVV